MFFPSLSLNQQTTHEPIQQLQEESSISVANSNNPKPFQTNTTTQQQFTPLFLENPLQMKTVSNQELLKMYNDLKKDVTLLQIWVDEIRKRINMLSDCFNHFNSQLETLINKQQKDKTQSFFGYHNPNYFSSLSFNRAMNHSFEKQFPQQKIWNTEIDKSIQHAGMNQTVQKESIQKKNEEATATQTRTRVIVRQKKKIEKLSDDVLKQIQRLKGEYKANKARKYANCDFNIPAHIQIFCDYHFPKLQHSKLGISDIEFIGEFALKGDIPEWMSKNKDAMLIGNGSALIGVLQKDANQQFDDFNIYIIEDNKGYEAVSEPMKLSTFLAGCSLMNE